MTYSVYPTNRFSRDLRRLIRQHRKADEDVAEIIELLEKGELQGEDIQGLNFPNDKVYKVRVKNTSSSTYHVFKIR